MQVVRDMFKVKKKHKYITNFSNLNFRENKALLHEKKISYFRLIFSYKIITFAVIPSVTSVLFDYRTLARLITCVTDNEKKKKILTWILQHLSINAERRGPLIHVVPQSVAGDYEKIFGTVQRHASDLRLTTNVRFIRDIA